MMDASTVAGRRITATIVAGVTAHRSENSWVRALSIADERTEVCVDDGARTVRVEIATQSGVLLLPRRVEAHGRLALRRVLDALDAGIRLPDFDEFVGDCTLALGGDKQPGDISHGSFS